MIKVINMIINDNHHDVDYYGAYGKRFATFCCIPSRGYLQRMALRNSLPDQLAITNQPCVMGMWHFSTATQT
jgi:hypothetical protein